MFDNRCPVCNNELIDKAYGRLCFGPVVTVLMNIRFLKKKENAQRRGNIIYNLILLRSRRTALAPLMKSTNNYPEE